MRPVPVDPVFRGVLLAALTACAAKPDVTQAPGSESEPAVTPGPGAELSDRYPPCPAEAWGPGRDVRPAEPVDGLQLRTSVLRRSGEVIERTEVLPVCTTASDAQACLDALDAYPLGRVRTEQGKTGEVRMDFAWTLGDRTGQIDSPDALIRWLGPIDSAADARTVVWADGYTPSCAQEPTQADGRWTLVAQKRVSDCPVTDNGYDLGVSVGGEVTVLQEHAGKEGKVCIGRLPPGLEEPAGGHGIGAWLADVAFLEAAAVVAFEQLVAELELHGAPRSLVDAARAARADEIRHAEAMTALAHRYGAEVAPVEVVPGPLRSKREIAEDNATEGLVRECYGAAVGLWQAKHAADPVLRAVFRQIALDEIRHAEFSLALHTWLDEDVDAIVQQARVALSPRTEVAEPMRRRLGLPTLAQAQTLFHGLWG